MNFTAFFVSIFLASLSTILAEVRLVPLFQNGMFLQREMTVPVWRVSDPGEKVTVAFAGQTKSKKADQSSSEKRSPPRDQSSKK